MASKSIQSITMTPSKVVEEVYTECWEMIEFVDGMPIVTYKLALKAKYKTGSRLTICVTPYGLSLDMFITDEKEYSDYLHAECKSVKDLMEAHKFCDTTSIHVYRQHVHFEFNAHLSKDETGGLQFNDHMVAEKLSNDRFNQLITLLYETYVDQTAHVAIQIDHENKNEISFLTDNIQTTASHMFECYS